MDKARKGYEWWDKINAVQRYSFIIGADGGVRRVENTSGNWIEASEAQAVVDDAQAEINVLRERLERIAPAAAPQPPSASSEREARYRFLLALLIERGVLTDQRYRNGIWSLQGIYGVDDSGLRGAGRSPEEAIDNAIVMAALQPNSAEWQEAWKRAHHRAATADTSPGIDAAEQRPDAWRYKDARGHWRYTGPRRPGFAAEYSILKPEPLYAAPPAAQPSADDKNFPFYELRFIMRVLSHQGSAPKEDWQTAYGMARDIFVRWSKERQAAEPHPPSRACMCDACKPSFENGADDPAQRYDIVRQVTGPSAEWLAEAERLVDFYAESFSKPTDSGKCRQRLAAMLAHLKART